LKLEIMCSKGILTRGKHKVSAKREADYKIHWTIRDPAESGTGRVLTGFTALMYCKAYTMCSMYLVFGSMFQTQIMSSGMNPCRSRRTSHMWKNPFEFWKERRRSSGIGTFAKLRCYGNTIKWRKQLRN